MIRPIAKVEAFDAVQDPALIAPKEKPAAYLGIREGIAHGERAIIEGRIVTHTEAKERLARWLK